MRPQRKQPGTIARIAQAAAAVLCLGLALSGAYAQQPPPTTTQAAPVAGQPAAATGAASTTAPIPATGPQRPIVGFITTILAGGGVNTLTISQPLDRVPEQITAEFRWKKARRGKQVFSCENRAAIDRREGLTKAERSEDVPDGGGKRTVTVVTISVPSPHCSWPPWQYAEVVLKRGTGDNAQPLLTETVLVSVFWFPFVIALAVVGIIYPGCAAIVWYIKTRRYDQAPSHAADDTRPDFWSSLDPVQITANPYGRASLGKLQIFTFSLLIFGLMLYYQLRTGILITLSIDILALLGISAVGATGGKLTQLAKRRLSFPNWAWLRRNGWLPNRTDDYSERARWRELITDFDGKEFDVYSFQMAIFSLIVAAALITTNLAGGEAFHIPAELLGLLGISQGVFIAGRAVGTSSYQELDKMLDDVRKQSNTYFAAKAAVPPKQTEVDNALTAFHEAVRQAALMFWDVYGEEIGTMPEKLNPVELEALTPETAATALGHVRT